MDQDAPLVKPTIKEEEEEEEEKEPIPKALKKRVAA